jgi:signal peptidase II
MTATAAAVFALDRAAKWLVVEAMDLRTLGAIDLAPGFLGLRMAWNRGINFGILASDSAGARWALIGLAVAISAGVAWWALRRGGAVNALGAGLLVGGAIGNALDRWHYGAVADFLNVTCCGIVNPYAFNVADVAIFAGALTLAFAPEHARRQA